MPDGTHKLEPVTLLPQGEAWRLLDELAALADDVELHTLHAEAAHRQRDGRTRHLAEQTADRLMPEVLERALLLGRAWSLARGSR